MFPINKISIIIPAYNEEKRLPEFLKGMALFCSRSQHRYELLIVDDGSSDGTLQAAEAFKKTLPIRVIRYEKNKGKGFALRAGMKEAAGDICVSMDADGSYDPYLIEQHLHCFREGYEVVIGSRFLSPGNYDENSVRKFLRLFFLFFVKVFLFRGIRDTQCGFKMYSGPAAALLFSKARLNGFGIDLELLYLAKRHKLALLPVAVVCEPKKGSKVRVVRDSVALFANILQIKLTHYS